MKYQIIDKNSYLYNDKIAFFNLIKLDDDFGNEGIIFVFIK